MPNSIVSLKIKPSDTIDLSTIKSITPGFYWCSAHEFVDSEFKENKFLIQYQTYNIENKNLEPSDIKQIWVKSKNEIRCHLITFLDIWNDHQRILFDPSKNIKILENDFESNPNIGYANQIQNFSDFASFVGKCIFDLKNLYINQFNSGNFLFLQKEFWKNTALSYLANNSQNKEKKGKAKKILKTKKKPLKKKKI